MPLTARAVADYLRKYAGAFQEEFARLTALPPSGAGYPALRVSPYLGPGTLQCIVSPDGVAVFSTEGGPEYQWWIAGGPALVVDYAESRTPQWVVDLLKAEGIWGKPIGLYRIVSKVALPAEVWGGIVEPVVEEAESVLGECRFRVQRTDLPRLDVIRRLTFGAFGGILDVHLPGPDSLFWVPHIIRRMGFVTADRSQKRFFTYLELLHHADTAAWDERSIQTRVAVDVRRDFAWAFSAASSTEKGGSLSFGHGQMWSRPFFDRLTILGSTLAEFGRLLEHRGDAKESVFHAFIESHPILLDVYAEAVSKPRWPYPAGESPLGKMYIEPDFVLKYPDGTYRLVELERPSKAMATSQGQPRAEVSQAAFQIGEWRAYIANHYDLLKSTFPGISIRHSATIVISRSSAASFGEGRDLRKYKELLVSQYQGVDILTYDELLDRARHAYTRLASLAIGKP